MGFFSFVQEIAMDLGTANTIIISDDKIVVDEPSVVALDRHTDKMIAVGTLPTATICTTTNGRSTPASSRSVNTATTGWVRHVSVSR